jgi:hypothetical protein
MLARTTAPPEQPRPLNWGQKNLENRITSLDASTTMRAQHPRNQTDQYRREVERLAIVSEVLSGLVAEPAGAVSAGRIWSLKRFR